MTEFETQRIAVRSRWRVRWIVLLSCLGALISGELLKRTDHLWGDASSGGFGKICAMAGVETACRDLAASRFGAFDIPIVEPVLTWPVRTFHVRVPTAFLGLVYFSFLLVWFWLNGARSPYRSWRRVWPLAAIGVGVVVSSFYLTLMALGAEPVCPGCLLTHAISFALALLVLRLDADLVAARHLSRSGPSTRRDSSEADDSSAPPVSSASPAESILSALPVRIAVATWMAVVAGLWWYRAERIELQEQINHLAAYKHIVTSLQDDPAFLLREFNAQTPQVIPMRKTEQRGAALDGDAEASKLLVRGAPAGPTTPPAPADRPELVVFTDFACPACACEMKRIRQEIAPLFGQTLDVRICHFPLDSACNGQVDDSLHPSACQAAYVAEAARTLCDADGFDDVVDLLFSHRGEPSPELVDRAARLCRVDPDDLVRTAASRGVQRTVQEDIRLAASLGVRGTPALFYNGRFVAPLLQTPVFWEALASRAAQTRADGSKIASAAGTPGAPPVTDGVAR